MGDEVLLITLAVFLITPVLSLPFIMVILAFDFKHYQIYNIIIALGFGLLGYSFVPEATDDLIRHFSLIETFGSVGIHGVLDATSNSFLVSQNMMFYFISLTSNYNLLPAISTFATYFCVTYIGLDVCKRNEIKPFFGVLALLTIMSVYPIINPLSGIRYSWAVSVFLLAVYRDLVQQNRNALTYCFYGFGLTMHYICFVLLIFRVITAAFKGRKKLIVYGITAIWPLLIHSIQIILRTFGVGYFREVANKLLYYTDTEGWELAAAVQSSRLMKLNRAFLICLCLAQLYVIYLMYSKHRNEYHRNRDVLSFILVLCIFSIASAPYMLMYDRFAYASILFSSIVVSLLLKSVQCNALSALSISLVLVCISALGIGYQFVRLQFWTSWVTSLPVTFASNVFTIMVSR